MDGAVRHRRAHEGLTHQADLCTVLVSREGQGVGLGASGTTLLHKEVLSHFDQWVLTVVSGGRGRQVWAQAHSVQEERRQWVDRIKVEHAARAACGRAINESTHVYDGVLFTSPQVRRLILPHPT